jgi:YVTN family beta-propeller protein
MAITQDGRTVYVSGDGSSSVDVIDTATDKVVKTINVGKAPNGVALTPDDRLLVVTVYGEDRIAFIDTSTQTVVANMAVPKPHTVAISPNGKLAYVTVQEPGHFGSPSSTCYAERGSHPLDKTPRDGEFGYDGKSFYFTQAGLSSVQVLDPASDKSSRRFRQAYRLISSVIRAARRSVSSSCRGPASCSCSTRRRTSRRAASRSANSRTGRPRPATAKRPT